MRTRTTTTTTTSQHHFNCMKVVKIVALALKKHDKCVPGLFNIHSLYKLITLTMLPATNTIGVVSEQH
jgi:hypothetical protein